MAANGTCIAREVGNGVGWHVYDHELLERIAQDMGLRTVLLESVDEREKTGSPKPSRRSWPHRKNKAHGSLS